ncbi:MAG TPA: hypothetical protein VK956_10600, partial [Verrucomicrobium sp.]|nr:hypothetical protein [Verrucomicrobium sp.]
MPEDDSPASGTNTPVDAGSVADPPGTVQPETSEGQVSEELAGAASTYWIREGERDPYLGRWVVDLIYS